MPFLRDSLTIFKREMLIFRGSYKTNIIRSVIFPLIFILFFGSLGSSFARGVPIAIVNYANNPQATHFISYLNSQTTQISIKTVTDQKTALSLLTSGGVNLVVVILPTFPNKYNGQPSVDLYYTNSFSVLGGSVPFISSAVSQFGASVQQSNPVLNGFLPSLSSASVSSNLISGAKGDYRGYITAGVIGMVVVFGAIFGGGISLLTDRQLGNLKAFLISPINKDSIVLGKILSGTVQSLLYGFIALGIGVLDGVMITAGAIGIIWIAIIVLILSFGFSAITIVLASRINKVEIYNAMAPLISLPLWFISGGLLPTNFLPGWLAAISIVDPLTYANNGIRAVIINGIYPLSTALPEIGFLIGFMAVCTILAFKLFKGSIE